MRASSYLGRFIAVAALSIFFQVSASPSIHAEIAPGIANAVAESAAQARPDLLRIKRGHEGGKSDAGMSSGTGRTPPPGYQNYERPKAPRSMEGRGSDTPRSMGRGERGRDGGGYTGGGDCSSCRAQCHVEWRGQCGYSGHCRKKYTSCMRGCWNNYCRR